MNIVECTPDEVRIDDEMSSGHVGANGPTNHRAADRALLEANVAALADREMAARDEHNGARGAHTHDARTVLRDACLLCGCGRGATSCGTDG